MIKKEYKPLISKQAIEQAISTPPEEILPLELVIQQANLQQKIQRDHTIWTIFLTIVGLLSGLILTINAFVKDSPNTDAPVFRLLCSGVYLVILVSVFMRTRPSQNKPLSLPDMLKQFYSHVKSNTQPQIKEYFLLAPRELASLSFEEFQQGWKEWLTSWQKEATNQHHAQCEKCLKEDSGYWSKKDYFFDESYIRVNPRYFKCRHCNSVFCSECFLSFDGLGRKCPKCNKNIKEFGPNIVKQGTKLMVVEPRINSLILHQFFDIKIIDQTETSANIQTTAVFKFQFEVIPNYLEIDEENRVTIHLYNTAVKIKDEWRLMAGLPSKLSSGFKMDEVTLTSDEVFGETEGDRND